MRVNAQVRTCATFSKAPQLCSIRAITSSAPAFDSGSLRLPHLGDCTHDGQPDSHGHSLISRCASPHEQVEVAKALQRDPDAAGVAVVDEDRRPAGLRMGVGRQPADVPAVAHRQQRQHRDLRVLGRVQRAEQQLAREVLEQLGTELVPQRLRRERVGRQVDRPEVEDLVVGQALALVGVDLLGDRHAAEAQGDAQHVAAVEQALDLGVGLALGLRVPVAVEGRDERAAAVEVELGRPRRSARGAGRWRRRGSCWPRARSPPSPAARRWRCRRPRRCRARPSAATRAPPGSPRDGAAGTARGARRARPGRRAGRRRPASAGRGSRRRVAPSGPSCAAHSRWARWIGSFSCQTIAASTGRSRNSSGWRQKNWSSASSPAT